MSLPYLVLALLFVISFSAATMLEPAKSCWTRGQSSDGGVLALLLGDGRRLFANHFFIKADVYLHSGFYPSIFDQSTLPEENHLSGEAEAHSGAREEDFPGPPKDWIDRLGRYFYPSTHSHLANAGDYREILPWLKLSADLDPQRVETYVTAAYWLRTRLGRIDEAERFLRQGRRANPDSYEILFELGRLYKLNRQDLARARNLWELALKKWHEREAAKPEPDTLGLEQILVHLAYLEAESQRLPEAIAYFEQAKRLSPRPEAVQQRIEELREKLRAAAH
jgi:tetratricopeptide (TPR) repeat protein